MTLRLTLPTSISLQNWMKIEAATLSITTHPAERDSESQHLAERDSAGQH
jgi:aromatic ring-cleaving dioxygenase